MVQKSVAALAVLLLAAPAVALKIERHAEAATDTDNAVEAKQASWTCSEAESRLKSKIAELDGATYDKDRLRNKIKAWGLCNLGPGWAEETETGRAWEWWTKSWWTATYPNAQPRDFSERYGPRAQADVDGKATSPHAARTANFRLSSVHEHKKGTKDTVITGMANKDGGLTCEEFLGGNCNDDEMHRRWWAFRSTCCVGLSTCGRQALHEGQAAAPGNYDCGANLNYNTENHNEVCTHVDDLSFADVDGGGKTGIGACEDVCCRGAAEGASRADAMQKVITLNGNI